MVLFLKFSPKTSIDRLEMGHAVTQLVEALRYNPEILRVPFLMA
jgi:hypothetical protein